MNREQSRREQFKKGGLTAQPLAPIKTLSIDYGHDGRNVMVIFTAKIENLQLTKAQVDGMIEGLKTAKGALMAHRAAAAREGGPGHG